MKYNGCEIRQNIITRKYALYDVFKKALTGDEYETVTEAKDAVDAILAKNRLKRYQPVHSSRYWWSVLDKTTQQYVKKENGKPVIQIFKDFFDSWKEEIKEYVKPLVDEYYEVNNEAVNMANNRFHFQELGYTNKEEFDDAYNKLRQREKELRGEPIVRTAIDKGLRRNPAEFNKYLDDYMNQRYYELVDKVTKIVGTIDDVSNLRVGMDGTLNGRVYGDRGGAKIDTIVAGGYNNNIIVNVKHGQIRHFRVLVHPIR